MANARIVAIGGVPQVWQTNTLHDQEVVDVALLPALGVEVNGNLLRYEGTALEWQPAPYISIATLLQLGIQIHTETPEVIDFAAASFPILNIRSSRTQYRGLEKRRIVLETNMKIGYAMSKDSGMLRVHLPALFPRRQWNDLLVEPSDQETVIQIPAGGKVESFTLENPPRIVLDLWTVQGPPPIDPDSLPKGVVYGQQEGLSWLSFDHALYQPKLVTAPYGQRSDLARLVQSVGGIAGINGGYFDTRSGLPVDLVVSNGQMLSPSLEKRATIGLTSQRILFGYPKPRYVLQSPSGSIMVNSVTPRVRREWLTAFVGDGSTPVGGPEISTLFLTPDGLPRFPARIGTEIPPKNTLALTFDPKKITLPNSFKLHLQWQIDGWHDVHDALAAGPLLIKNGQIVLQPTREGFQTSGSIWRATRQVAFGILADKPTLFYLEHGTPETFAAALQRIGASQAIRLDSGSSASVYLKGGYAGLGGYLNHVWGQKIPNALVFIPR